MCDVKIIRNGYTCIDCNKRTVFVPSLKDRGMTPSQAKSIFVDGKGGRCTKCFLVYRDGDLNSDHSLLQENVLRT